MQNNDDLLGLFAAHHDDPMLERLTTFLRGREWLNASQLQDALGPEYNDRKIRALAEAADGQILSYPGSPGYRLTREATADERDTAINKLRSQADKMTRRALTISRTHRSPAEYV